MKFGNKTFNLNIRRGFPPQKKVPRNIPQQPEKKHYKIKNKNFCNRWYGRHFFIYCKVRNDQHLQQIEQIQATHFLKSVRNKYCFSIHLPETNEIYKKAGYNLKVTVQIQKIFLLDIRCMRWKQSTVLEMYVQYLICTYSTLYERTVQH